MSFNKKNSQVSFHLNQNNEEIYDIPLDISDIINICREYNKLGWHIQSQIENILEVGVEESIKTGLVKKSSLPHIKQFLKAITSNSYFGDAVSQSEECLSLINDYESRFSNKLIDSVLN